MHPRIGEMLDIAHEKGFKVNITTNGTLIKKNRDKLLGKPALRQINFSLHSFDGHEGSENREKYLGDILAFVRDSREHNIIISYRLWNLQKEALTDVAARRNRETLEILEKEYGLDYLIEERVQPGKGLKIEKNIYLNQDHEFRWPALHEKADEGRGFCHALRTHAAILVDGTVVPCCLDGEGVINLGNVNEQNFSTIIASERATNLVDGFSKRQAVEELCKKCGFRQKFGMTEELIDL